MVDIVDAATRSRMMSGIRSKDTRPEIALRKALHRLGFRYRLHSPAVPGKPDMIFPAYHAAVFVHGCFWHGHDCAFFKAPQTRREFWLKKIARNRARDVLVRNLVAAAGWRQLIVWECAIRGRGPIAEDKTAAQIARWLRTSRAFCEIRGQQA